MLAPTAPRPSFGPDTARDRRRKQSHARPALLIFIALEAEQLAGYGQQVLSSYATPLSRHRQRPSSLVGPSPLDSTNGSPSDAIAGDHLRLLRVGLKHPGKHQACSLAPTDVAEFPRGTAWHACAGCQACMRRFTSWP